MAKWSNWKNKKEEFKIVWCDIKKEIVCIPACKDSHISVSLSSYQIKVILD